MARRTTRVNELAARRRPRLGLRRACGEVTRSVEELVDAVSPWEDAIDEMGVDAIKWCVAYAQEHADASPADLVEAGVIPNDQRLIGGTTEELVRRCWARLRTVSFVARVHDLSEAPPELAHPRALDALWDTAPCDALTSWLGGRVTAQGRRQVRTWFDRLFRTLARERIDISDQFAQTVWQQLSPDHYRVAVMRAAEGCMPNTPRWKLDWLRDLLHQLWSSGDSQPGAAGIYTALGWVTVLATPDEGVRHWTDIDGQGPLLIHPSGVYLAVRGHGSVDLYPIDFDGRRLDDSIGHPWSDPDVDLEVAQDLIKAYVSRRGGRSRRPQGRRSERNA